jgi:hypothetical protein
MMTGRLENDIAPPWGRQPGEGPCLVVASFDTYQEARSLVDQLAEQEMSTDSVLIKLEEVRSAENLPGGSGRGRAFGEGAASGALIGAVFGAVLGLVDWTGGGLPIWILALSGFLTGVIAGGVFGLAGYKFSERPDGFASVGPIKAERYDVMVDAPLGTQASKVASSLIGRSGASGSTQRSSSRSGSA